MLRVSVPATLSNLGPGYDVLGLSVGLTNRFSFTFEPGWAAEGIAVDPAVHLTLHTARAAAAHFGLPLAGLQVWQEEQVPRARGLGSSATARVAGLLAALSTRAEAPPLADQLEFLAAAEGHPDNVVPALVGGLNMIVRDGSGRLRTLRFPPPPGLRVALCVPDVEVRTDLARSLLPATVPHADAVFQAGRMAFLVVGLLEGRLDALAVGIEDRLHQRWRMPLIGPADEAFERARALGSVPFVSGSGSTLAAFVPVEVDAEIVAEAMCGPFRERGIAARAHSVEPVEGGALVAH